MSLSTGSLVIDNSSLIHDFYANECQTTSPIHLVVDTSLPAGADAMNVKVLHTLALCCAADVCVDIKDCYSCNHVEIGC